eukprot:scaffold9764_cov144-Chaetoceros_neogracile.AAC.1
MPLINIVEEHQMVRLSQDISEYIPNSARSIVGLMGKLGTDQSPTLSRSGIESSTTPNYQHASFDMIDLLNPNKRIDPEAFKSLLQDDDDTPI